MVANIICSVLIFISAVLLAIPVAALMKKTYNNDKNFMDFFAPSFGTLKTESYTFDIFLFSVIMILSVLSMFIVFIMGPVIEHCQLIKL